MNPQVSVKYNQPTPEPTPKTAAAGIGGSVSVILIWLTSQFFSIEIPPEIAAAITTVIAFVSAYMTRDKKPPQAVEEILNKE